MASPHSGRKVGGAAQSRTRRTAETHATIAAGACDPRLRPPEFHSRNHGRLFLWGVASFWPDTEAGSITNPVRSITSA